MNRVRKAHTAESYDITHDTVKTRSAVGYIRVSTDMQASDGLSLTAQSSTIEQYYAMQGLALGSRL